MYNNGDFEYMPKLPTHHDYKCLYCGKQANYVTVRTKKYRCEEIVTRCLGIIEKSEISRNKDPEKRKAHMKNMSKIGNEKLKELHNDETFLQNKSIKIKTRISERGGLSGTKNPNYGRIASENKKLKMKSSAAKRNNENIGKYKRTIEHRDKLSIAMIERNRSGILKKTSNTKPERLFETLIKELNIDYQKQYLIQFGKIKEGKRFRHCYDFYLPKFNLLVEIDGDFWHSLPNIIERDKICNQVAKSKNYNLIRILQSDLENNFNKWRNYFLEL